MSFSELSWSRCAGLVVAVVIVMALVLLAIGRTPLCTCGTIKLWHGVVQSAENSQHLSDWYTFTHVVHGFVFYGLLARLARRWSRPARLVVAAIVEGSWEVVENTAVIDRYRQATIALDYFGDSVLNSVSDVAAMTAGFLLSARAPAWFVVGAAVIMELGLGYAIRDNLTLNVLMLIYPIDAIRQWQAGA